MKRSYLAIGLCLILLLFEASVFLPASAAKSDLAARLLDVPAPPPPNPLVPHRSRLMRDPEFYSKSKVPSDDAPIDDLIEYWSANYRSVRMMTYAPEPSERSLDRLYSAIEKDPLLLPKLIGSFPDTPRAAELAKGIYDREGTSGIFDTETREAIRQWLLYHSPYYSAELARLAEKVSDAGSYVSSQDELLALARVDFDKARPIIDRLNISGSDKATKVLARWALYRHALDTDSLSDIERYRQELKAAVEDKGMPGPTRDLALDALVTEKEWPERDDWYMSLMSDETLADLQGYTGLTTIINVSPPNKYIDKMLALLKSDSKAVRSAAVRNLLLQSISNRPDVMAALLPWLDDPDWAADIADSRSNFVLLFRSVKLPESVPGLIKILDERKKQLMFVADTTVSAANAAVAASTIRPAPSANAITSASVPGMIQVERYAYRTSAIYALGFQGDPAAGPALRRVLPEVESWERPSVIEAINKCRGFTVPEQIEALEAAVRSLSMAVNAENLASGAANLNSGDPTPSNTSASRPSIVTPAEIKQILGDILIRTQDPSDELADAVAARIETLDGIDPKLAGMLRRIVLQWPNRAVDLLFLRDLRNDRSEVESVVRLLSKRSNLRQAFSANLTEAAAANSTAAGIVTCLAEDPSQYDGVLDSQNGEAKAAFLACSRLIRARLPVAKVAELARESDRRISLAAEKYLESEDSPAARAVVLGMHPGEAKILGATTAFFSRGRSDISMPYLSALFSSVEPGEPAVLAAVADSIQSGSTEEEEDGESHEKAASNDLGWQKAERLLQAEVKKDAGLLGVYAYDGNYIRIYKDRVVYSFDDDESRYRERPLGSNEFDELKSYLTENRVDELAPFLTCPTEYCASKELLMLGRDGGRRVYLNGDPPDFFKGLDKYFAELRLAPSTLKYTLSRDLPGLEIVLANDDLHAETVWKEGDELRVAVSDKAARKRVKEEIDKAVETASVAEEQPGSNSEDNSPESIRARLTSKREFDGYSWRKIVGGMDTGIAPQPNGIELIPANDSLSAAATQEQWKARAANFEIRASENGIFKLTAGRLTAVKTGFAQYPVISADGKWLAVYHANNESAGLVRINLLTNRVYPVNVDEYNTYFAYAYLPNLSKFLIVEQLNEEGEHEGPYAEEIPDDNVRDDPEASALKLLDPATGAIQAINGEFRPIAQQTFRPLQPTGKLNEFWAAIPNKVKNETQIGTYDTVHFAFKPILRVPKIMFNSMSMWVDSPGKKVYFVYRGHLLSLPLGK